MTTVFLVNNLQGDGRRAICSTLLGAKRWLMQSIIDLQAEKDPESRNDPNPWDGWEWWTNEEGDVCFGGVGSNPKRIAEGFISAMEVLDY